MESTIVVDRENRNRLIAELDRCLNGEITPIQLGEWIHRNLAGTHDLTLRQVARSFWIDPDDDFMTFDQGWIDKSSWDRCQRVKLLLMTDGHIVSETHMRWDWWQLVAAGLFGLALWEFAITGWQPLAILLLWKLGIAAQHLCRARDWWGHGTNSSNSLALAPFASHAELLSALRRAPDYRKQRYPGTAGVISPSSTALPWLGTVMVTFHMSLFSLIVLIILAFPASTTSTRVKFPPYE